ncbi:hypothetical protein [Brevundimonas fluminis]|uniref:hypothetical protein n=1 Tax=Brevundimonas fluminis TaxID=2487274 RepID=UPI000F656C75|nr:hypothetical protein [Brevundimonas fluminis]
MADGSPPARANPRIAPDAVWAQARADYLAGLSAPQVCRRHGVGLSTLRDRAAREGWRRVDQPWTPPDRLDPDDEGRALELSVDGDLDRVDPRQLSWVAARRMMRAAMRGDAVEALRWRRVRLAMDAEEAELARFLAAEDQAGRRIHGAPDPDSPDCPDPVFPSGQAGRPP